MTTLQPSSDWRAGESNNHYDQDPAFFATFLDRVHMKYSPGIFDGRERTLEEAQSAKLHYIAQSLGVQPGSRVLDVGCGWGSLSCFLASEYRCQVVSITPARRQAEYVRRRAAELGAAGRVRIEVGHFPDEIAVPPRSFDAVAYVGSITHVHDKALALRRTFETLVTGGRVYISESCFRNVRMRHEFERRPGTQFVLRETFGFAELNPISDYVVALEDAGFSLTSLRDLTEEYRRTIEAWAENARSNRDRLERFAQGATDRLLRYFEVCNTGWGYTTKQYALVASKSR